MSMRRILQSSSWLALAGTIVPPVLYYEDLMALETVKTVMLVATVVWFAATSLWMGRQRPGEEEDAVPPGDAPSGVI